MSESPTKSTTIRPLELHSPNTANVAAARGQQEDFMASSPKSKQHQQLGSPMKYTPSLSSAVPRMPYNDNNDEENRRDATTTTAHGRGRCGDVHVESEESFMLSPIGGTRMGFGTPSAIYMNLDTPQEVNGHVARRLDDDGNSNLLDSSFPDNEIEIHSPRADNETEEEEGDDRQGNNEEEETEEQRLEREIDESEALARQLMAEEAMASYAMSSNYLRDNADQFSEEDLAALQAAMAEEDPDDEHVNEEELEGEETTENMSYDALLRLGEQIGDVKQERWELIAQDKINALPTLRFDPSMAKDKEENHTEVKCQVCQFPYEEGEELRRLPLCGHCFHKDCIDSWLRSKDTCALCRKSIVP